MSDESLLDAAQLARIKARLKAGGEAPAARDEPSGPTLPDLGVIFFSGLSEGADPYALLMNVATFADGAGFTAIWTPERHFTEVGGAYPNPSVLGAALAMVTKNVRIRAGSVNVPLHDTLRLAEEWAVVDNLSGGRVDLALAPGWHARDFVLNPAGYETRPDLLQEGRKQLQDLWRGTAVKRADPTSAMHEILTYPRPVQPELPVWLTSSQSTKTWQYAGENGLNVLTALINFGPAELAKRIELYRDARASAGLDPALGVVSLMLHTYVGDDTAEAVNRVRPALTEYLSSFVSQHETSGQQDAQGKSATLRNLGDDRADFLEMVFQRYVSTSSLIGDPDRARETLAGFAAMGVDEVACLVDFGLPETDVLESLARLATVLPDRS